MKTGKKKAKLKSPAKFKDLKSKKSPKGGSQQFNIDSGFKTHQLNPQPLPP